jgi:hypothetical protein
MRFLTTLRRLLLTTGAFLILFSACRYQRGDMYYATSSGDTLSYLVLNSGKGTVLSKKAAHLKQQHEYRGNVCQIRYLTDSAGFIGEKGVLLMNTTLPDIQEDILTKGYIGSLTSRQIVLYVMVSNQDFERFFRESKAAE